MANSKKIFLFLVSAAAALALASCFTGYSGTGTLSISIGGAGNSRALLDIDAELASMEHEVTLRGPGGTITKTFRGAATATFELSAGQWDISVRAVGDTPPEYNRYSDWTSGEELFVLDIIFPPRTLRAMGWDTVDIKAGQSRNARIDMISAGEVSSYEQLRRIYDQIIERAAVREIFLVTGDIVLNGNNGDYGFFVGEDWDITLMADEAASIAVLGNMYNLFDVSYGTLTLGRPGMRGSLVIDAGGESFVPTVNVSSGELIMHDGVTLRNGGGGAVKLDGYYDSTENITYYGYFTMFGGDISGNGSTPAEVVGGGVQVGGFGIFDMYGGSIRNNTAVEGGGVYVEDGTFKMHGGTISGNDTPYNVLVGRGYGGGVCVQDGYFVKSGGTIYGIDEDSPLRNEAESGEGHAVYVGGDAVLYIPAKGRNKTAGPDIYLDTELTDGWDW